MIAAFHRERGSAVKTRKLLAACREDGGDPVQGDFLVPLRDGGELRLFGLASGAFREQGLVVYTGREVTAEDLRARLAGTGRAEDARSRADLVTYLGFLQAMKIGNVVALAPAPGDPEGFILRKLRERPPVTPSKLP